MRKTLMSRPYLGQVNTSLSQVDGPVLLSSYTSRLGSLSVDVKDQMS